MYVQQFFVDGLGCASYLVGESQGLRWSIRSRDDALPEAAQAAA
jgi:hypothetical protein